MKITIYFDEKQNSRSGYWIDRCLKDAAWSLDINLRKCHKASASATFSPGRAEFDIAGADHTVLEPYMTSLQVTMNKEGFRVLIEYG